MIRIVCALLLACGIPGSVFASGPTEEQSAFQQFANQAGPLTLSNDGKWRIHVDAANVMHRVSLKDAKETHTLRLGWPVNALASSDTGSRVVFTSASRCIGVVDFEREAAKIRWLASGPALLPHQVEVAYAHPGKPAEHLCGSEPVLALALSSDGRLLATEGMLYDLNKQRALTRFTPKYFAFKLQFVDHDSKLLMVSAITGEAYEALGTPSALQVSVWTLADRSLYQLITRDHADLDSPLAWFVDFSRHTNLAVWAEAVVDAKTAQWPPRLELKSRSVGSCHATTSARWALPALNWENAVVDPRGRWIAAVHRLDETTEPKSVRDGFQQQLLVYDLQTQREIARLPLKHGMRGLVARNDGMAIFGLSGGDETVDGIDRRLNLGGDLMTFNIPAGTKPSPLAAVWDAQPCLEEGESPDARTIARVQHRLRPLWTMPLSLTENECYTGIGLPDTLLLPDGSVWIHRDNELAQVDTASGKIGARRPVPHKKDACTVPIPAAGGFVRYQGDTLSLTPFDAGPQAKEKRSVDVRPGWKVNKLWLQGRALGVHWTAKEGTLPKTGPDQRAQDLRIVTYDAATLRQVASELANFDEVDYVGHVTDPGIYEYHVAPCHDAVGPMASAYDVRSSHFGTVRAYACAGSLARTVFWSGLQLGPGMISTRDVAASRVWDVVGGLAVVSDWDGMLHVYDLAARRDIAQIDLHALGPVTAAQIYPSKGLILVESGASPYDAQRILGAYAIGQTK